MRRLGTDEWSGLSMLAVSIAVGGPVLFGAAETTITRGWWAALFATLIVSMLVALGHERPSAFRFTMFAVAVMSSWAVVLTAPTMGLLPILLVITAAVSVYVVPLRVGFTVVGLNTAILSLLVARQNGTATESMIVMGFYLLIQLATVLSSVTLIREQRMRRELAEAHIDLRAASALLAESARTTERLRISRDLHDLIGHQLTLLTLELEAARHRDGKEARDHVDHANKVARDLLADVRSTVGELRTEPSHLSEALSQVVSKLPGLDVSIDVDADLQVDETQSAALVRAAQEIVTNTIRHADARELRLEISYDGTAAVLVAADDGRGAREPVLGNGLLGLTERFETLGGDVTFDGCDGFRVTARMPTS